MREHSLWHRLETQQATAGIERRKEFKKPTSPAEDITCITKGQQGIILYYFIEWLDGEGWK